MSGRFAILNTEGPSKKLYEEHVQENSKGNIFRQKPKPGRLQGKSAEDSSRWSHKNHTNNKNDSSRNRFRLRQSRTKIVKEVEFDIKECNFPGLGGCNTETIKDSVEESYKSKIEKTKEEKRITEALPPGWISLTKISPKFLFKNAPIEKECNPYYNPRGVRLIIENRREYREELNDILGDMSPYWNMDLEAEEDMEDYDDDAYFNDMLEEEEDYVEEW